MATGEAMLKSTPAQAGKLFLAITCAVMSGTADAQNTRTDRIQREQIEEYCIGCHNFEDYAGSLELETILNDPLSAHAEEWEKAIRKLRAGMMPPPGQDRPNTEAYLALTEWLENRIDEAAPLNPGTKTLHRLNQSEYANAIEELLGIRIDPSLYLPADSAARGFDNQAGSLTISPTLLEAYTRAASRIARMAVGTWNSPTEMTYIVDADNSQNVQLDGMPFNTRGGIAVEHNFPADGEYAFSMQNFGLGSYIPGEKLEISIDGERMHLFDYTGLGIFVGMGGDHDGSLDVTLPVKAGTHLVGATFVATNFRPDIGLIQEYDRKSIENNDLPQVQYHPAIGMLKISGPFNAQVSVDSPSREKIFICSPANADEEAECAERILLSLTRKAFRRPVTETDIAPMMTFYNEGRSGGSFDDGIELAVRRLLADPEFLVRREQEPANVAEGESYAITDLELASRLSFFLWSSIPDETLLEIAADDGLKDPAVLESQVMRMLADPRAANIANNFGYQWLGLAELDNITPDGTLFRDVDRNIRDDLTTEALLFLQSNFSDDRSVLDLLTAEHTYLNENLALHYGISDIRGSEFRRVDLEDERRWGLLGKGGVLMVSSYPNRTSPVLRGAWLLENILGTPPAAPPPDVEGFVEIEAGERFTTVRERLESHRSNPSCNGCHGVIDPLGFALENFDAVGRWRDIDRMARTPIDASGVLADGTPVNGPVALRAAFMQRPEQFVQTFTEKLMLFALGRRIEYQDMPAIRQIVREAAVDNYRFSSLVLGIVNSEQFRMKHEADPEFLAANAIAGE